MADVAPTVSTRLGDAELLTLARGGRRTAIMELWKRHAGPGLAVARGLAPFQERESLSERAWSLVLDPTNTDQPEGGFRAYLYSTLHTLSLEESSASPGSSTRSGTKPAPLVRAYRGIPSRWREVLWYGHVESMKAPQIGLLMGVPPADVPELLHRAREGLRRQWVNQHLTNLDKDSDCTWAWEHSSAYVRGLLNAQDEAWMDDHCRTCPTCRSAGSDAISVASRLATVVLPVVAGAEGGAELATWIRVHGPDMRTPTPVPSTLRSLASLASPTPTSPTPAKPTVADSPTRSDVDTPTSRFDADDDPLSPAIARPASTRSRSPLSTGVRTILIAACITAAIIIATLIATSGRTPLVVDPHLVEGPVPSAMTEASLAITEVDTGTQNTLFPIVTGRATPGSVVEVTIGETQMSTEADTDGLWNATIDQAESFQTRGRISAISSTTEVAALYELADPPQILDSSTPPTVTGIPGAAAQILVDGVESETITLDGSGQGSLTIPISAGSHFVQARYTEDERFGPASEAVGVDFP